MISLLAAASEQPDAVALVDGPQSFSFAALAREVRPLIDRLAAAALPAGRPVALVAHADLSSLLALYALLEHRTPALLIHPRLTPAERAALLADAQPALLIDGDDWVSPGESDAYEYVPNQPLDSAHIAAPGTAVILYTSGSTARPRGVQLSWSALHAAAAASAANLGWRPGDRWLLCLPFAHVGGLSIVTRCLAARRAVVLGAPDPEAIATAVAAGAVTLMSLVPTTLQRLLDIGWRPPAQVRAILVGGAACPPGTLARARDGGWPILITYGLTETAAQVATQRPGTALTPDSAPPLPGIDVRIAAGRIQVRGPTLMTAYFPAAPAPINDGWLDTGDLGELDPEGRVRVHGRAADLIITGGENVSPLEVEAALTACPGVRAACVFGVPDPLWGHVVAAALVPAGDNHPPDSVLAAALTSALASFKRPRRIAWLGALPALPSGKPDRAATARAAAATLRPLTY